ncbi:SRPBCC domain-containing protein [Paenibacillus sp. LHD-117]|uniref:SRPBCC domain-containing protein n=1 Tax=Paenibacillus sp. LHD-117 TaxID=3071412 RepID=UPI0027E1E899|nr:SRPBCC domain-containing protein [Paenibacillus sp. LHD-117]MDQ6418141.1 SRPBCC domain-containing protein [Paenibacillus sp. LHD-117]
MANAMVTKVEGNVLTLERVFDAPPELVFQVFTQAEHLKQWWGPRGWAVTVCKVDFRPGGVWHYCMKCEDKDQGDFFGMESWGKGIYKEIVDGEKFVYVDHFSDAEGNVSQEMPAAECTILFESFEGKTKLISITKYDTAEALQAVLDMGMEQGIKETWDRLGEHLQNIQ